MKRPLGIVALLYGCGVLLGEGLRPPLGLLICISLAVAGGALLIPGGRAALLWLLLLLSGWTNAVWRTSVVSPNDLRTIAGQAPQLASVQGRLANTPELRVSLRRQPGRAPQSHTLGRLEVQSLSRGAGWRPATGTVIVSTRGELPREFHAGQTVEITGVLAVPPGRIAEGLFDYRAWLRRQGIHYLFKAQSSNDWRRLTPDPGQRPVKDRFLRWARGALARGLPAEDESLRLEWALALGDRSVLTDDIAEPFVRAATYHIFAVDGLRMAILFGILLAICKVFRLPRGLCGLLLLPVIWSYTGLTGWPASAIRASIMLTVVIAGWVLKRPNELINSLFTAAFVILIWDPQQLFQAGFQLSFLVVLSLVVVLPPLHRFCRRFLEPDPFLPHELRPRWRRVLRVPSRYVMDLALTSLAAWLGSIPLVAYYFHIATPVSGPANVVAVPLCALVLISNFTSLLLAGWFPAGAEVFNHAGWFLMECIRVTSRWFADLPGAYFYVATPSLPGISLYYLALLSVFSGWIFKPPRRTCKLAALGVLLLAGCWHGFRERSVTRLTILPLNGGSAVFFNAPGSREDLLFDCGNPNGVEFILKPFLRAQGVNRLPCLALTHGDAKQMGGAERLLELFPIQRVAHSPVRFRSQTYRRVMARLDKQPRRRHPLKRGDQLNGWTVLHPAPEDRFIQADDSALVLMGDICGTRILLLSDLGRPGQRKLLERTKDLHADIVVSGLPQRGEPLSEAILNAIRPKLIIVADSEFPASRRAAAALRERLAQHAIPVLYTRHAGAVTLHLRQGRWSVATVNPYRPTVRRPAHESPAIEQPQPN